MDNKLVAVVTASEARERDAQAIASGVPSRQLMQNAGIAAASQIARFSRGLPLEGVEIHTGPGNNGGDGWVVAGELARIGIPVRVVEAEVARSPDALDAKAAVANGNFEGEAAIVVDALLGTGSRGPLSGKILESVRAINTARESGARVVALDIPTGLDATTGIHVECVQANDTLTFGTIKRGQLVARDVCGTIKALDIGLGKFGSPGANDLTLASPDWVSEHIPATSFDAHKGTRKRLAIVAGDEGMAGAAILAGQAALRSGIGLLHLVVARANRDAVHSAIPAALVSTHDDLMDNPSETLNGASALVVGPGLRPDTAKNLLAALTESRIPAVLDAGALGTGKALSDFCRGRDVILTPHPAEMARILEMETPTVLERRFEVGAELARAIGATVLLKGTPTVISNPEGRRMVSATGTSALATGGSGDLLSGIIGTLVAQTARPFESAVCGAWVHGRAAELCGSSRGVTLDDILFAMPAAWAIAPHAPTPPVLASLPAVQ